MRTADWDGCRRGKVSIGFESRPTKSARQRQAPSSAPLRYALAALALQRHNLEGGQLFGADPGHGFGAV
jgi:hypothetical protein